MHRISPGISSLADELSRLPDTADYIVLGKSSQVEDIFSDPMSPSPDVELALRNEDVQGVFTFPVPADVQLRRHGSNCWTYSLATCISVVGIFTVMIVLRGYVRTLLLWIELQEVWLSFGIFLALFLFVSFPFTWGYLVLNITAGYLYGLIQGVVITSASAAYGIFVVHIFLRRFCSNYVKSKLNNKSMNAVLKVLEGQQSFKVVALTRLTPIPFGLQNAFFAANNDFIVLVAVFSKCCLRTIETDWSLVTNITMSYYMSASVCGLLPTQFLNTYIGSTLRSMEDVLSDESTAFTGYLIFATQLLLTVLLMVIVIRRARVELNTLTLEESETSSKLTKSSNWSQGQSSYLVREL